MRLTFKEPDGTWGIKGMNEENQDEKMYGVACKLRDYEETGLEPTEVEQLKEDSVQFIINKMTEKRERISKELESSKDTFEKLLKFQVIGNLDETIKMLKDFRQEYGSGSRKEEHE